MKVDIWSDIRCPFCFVGKRNFEKALAQFEARNDIEVTWHSFQLDPDLTTQPDLEAIKYFMKSKGISESQTKQMFAHAKQAGKNVGIDFNFEDQKIANSFRAHLLLHLAAKHGLANEAEEALFTAQLVDGKNIDDENTLIEIGKSLSLKEEEITAALVSDDFKFAVKQDMQLAQQMGISGVPFFVINDKYGVSGAQPTTVFTEVLEKSWQEFSKGDKGLHIIHQGESCDTAGNCN